MSPTRLHLSLSGLVAGCLALGACSPGNTSSRTSSTAEIDAAAAESVAVAMPAAESQLLPPSGGSADPQSFETALVPLHDIEIFSRLDNEVVAVDVDEGRRVVPGARLAQMDDRDRRATLDMREAEVARAESAWQRAQRLKDQGVISEEQFIAAKSDWQIARAQRDGARVEVERCAIRTPIRGLVEQRMVQMGQSVKEGDLLFRIGDPDTLRAELLLPESRLGTVRAGQPVRIIPTAGGPEVVARVTRVNPLVDAASGTFRVVIDIDNRSGRLHGGVSARIVFEGVTVEKEVAVSSHYPKLRTDLTWRRFVSEGEDSYIFKDEITQSYVKLDAISGSLALRLDGNTSPDELLDWAQETWPSLDFDADFIADVVADVKRYGFIDDPFQRNAMLRAKAREERTAITAASFKNIAIIPFGSVNPDRFLTRTYPYIKFLFTPRAIAIGVSLFLLALWVVWTHRVRMAEQAYELAHGSGLGLWGYVLFMVASMGAIVIHEFGHGWSVKHFGGRVSKIGFLIVFGLPGMYCDTSDSHLFANWKHRACVALAGTYIELYVAVLATLGLVATPSDLMINKVAYDIIVVASVSGLAFNFNPLIKLDGYYVLSDVLDQPNLQEDAYAYVGYLVRRYGLLRQDAVCPVEGRRRKRILAAYGIASVLYTAIFGWIMYFVLRNFFISAWSFTGALIAALLLLYVIRLLSRPLVHGARAWALDHRGQIRRHQLPIVAAASLLLAAFLLLPVPGRRVVTVELEPRRVAAVVAPEALQLREASWRAGQEVHAGQVLAVLDADREAALSGRNQAEAHALRIQSGQARQERDDATAMSARAEATAAEERARLLEERVDRAELRAPFDGRVLSPSLLGQIGARYRAGDTLCVVADLDSVRATARLWEFDMEGVLLGSPASIRLRSQSGQVLQGRISEIQPAAEDVGGQREYRVRIALAGMPGEIRPGLTGRAWITTAARSPAAHLARALARFVRLDLWV